MKEKKTKDPIVTELMNQLADRSNRGIIKYKNTMKSARMNKIQAIENSIEELLDLSIYLTAVALELHEKYKKLK